MRVIILVAILILAVFAVPAMAFDVEPELDYPGEFVQELLDYHQSQADADLEVMTDNYERARRLFIYFLRELQEERSENKDEVAVLQGQIQYLQDALDMWRTPRNRFVVTANATITSKPGTGEVHALLDEGTPVTAFGYLNRYRHVITINGETGWIRDDLTERVTS